MVRFRFLSRNIFVKIIAVVCFFISPSWMFAQSQEMIDWGTFRPYEKNAAETQQEWRWSLEEAKSLGELAPTRFLSVDRFANKYPSLTPYHYAANNPLIFIDTTGDTLEIIGYEQERLRAFEAVRTGLPKEVRDAVQLVEIDGRFFIDDKVLNEARRLSRSDEFLALRQIVNSPGMAQFAIIDDNVQFQYFDKSLGQNVPTSFGQLGESFKGITFTTDIANTIYDRANIVTSIPGVNQSFVRSSLTPEVIVQYTAHELYGHIRPQLLGQRASHYQVGDSFDKKIEQIMRRALINFRRK